MRRATIAEVARVAGVSKSTVSRVLNGATRYVREETQKRVQEAIDSLGYRPSTVARSLVSRRTLTAGLLISDVGNPYYAEVIRGVEDAAAAYGYDIFLCNTNYDLDRVVRFVRSLVDKRVDGALMMSSGMSDEVVRELAEHEIPVVIVDWEIQDVGGIVATISVDFEVGIRAAVDHLVALGHRDVAHVSGPLNLRTSRLRRDAFLRGLEAHGLDPTGVVVVEGNLRIDGGRRALEDLLAAPKRPTAVFAANDLTAIGLMWAAREQGLRVPHDLSVIGLDNIQLAAEVTPPLTTVELPRYEIGSMAMRILLGLLQGEPEPSEQPVRRHEVRTRLVVRESTACVPVWR